mmetsp:Transcript_119404/g.380808  ORF Transcript_119404/g.380808 Transcript_119404/m.380808 type:complete len:232 (-) Transcript_119404:69-764(-)
MTFGHLCAALVRRLAGVSLGTFFRREVAEPLGLDLHFGLAQGRLASCAELSSWPEATIDQLKSMTPLSPRGLFEPDLLFRPSVVNSAEWRQAEIPAVNLHGSARDVAKVCALLANGGALGDVRLLRSDTAALLQFPSDPGVDKVFGFESSWALGFQHRPWVDEASGTGRGTRFGLGGIGGSSAFGCILKDEACDEAGLGTVGFAYLTREMGMWERAESVEDALLEALLRAT